MLPNTTPTTHSCSCGGRLRWELRESVRGARWMAMCDRSDCGRYVSGPSTGSTDDPLQDFLIAGAPPHPNRRPWVRAYLRSCRDGHSWVAHIHACRDCGSELLMRLDLQRPAEYSADPWWVLICLGCGRTAMKALAHGEFVEVHLSGDEWNDPGPELRLLKRTLRERVGGPVEPDEMWDFAGD